MNFNKQFLKKSENSMIKNQNKGHKITNNFNGRIHLAETHKTKR